MHRQWLRACFILAVCASCLSLPIIDVAPLMATERDSDALNNCTEAIVEAMQDSGIFLIVGHGIDTKGDVHFHAGDNLFGLEEEVKREVSMGAEYMRGYIPFGAESGLRQSVMEPKEL